MELVEKIDLIENDVAGLKVDMHNMKGWQKSQNGAIYRVEGKVENLRNWIMGVMATSILTLVGLIFQLLKG